MVDEKDRDGKSVRDLCQEILDTLDRLSRVDCPGCGREVHTKSGEWTAICRHCNLVAHLKWTWQPPVDNNIRSEEDIPLGAEAKCRWCKSPIEWMGEYWRHKGKKSYRHQAEPPENFLQGESDDEEI